MKPIVIFAAGLIAVGAGLPAAAKAEDASLGMPGPAVRGIKESILAWRPLLRSAHDKAYRRDVEARVLVAHLPRSQGGRPGREIYEDCPAGTTVGYSSQDDRGWRGEPDQCVRRVDVCRASSRRDGDAPSAGLTINRRFGRDGESCIQQVATPRPRRADPWFFDVPNDNGAKERFWFNLNH